MKKKKSALTLAIALGLTTTVGFGNVTQAETEPQTYLVVFKQETGLPNGYDSLIAAAGGQITRSISDLGAVQVVSSNPDFLETVEASDLVLEAGLENTIYPEPVEAPEMLTTDLVQTGHADLYETYGWDIKQVTGNGAAWSLPGGTGKSVDGKDIVVAVVDTGIDYTHPDLKKNYLYGKSFVPGYSDPMDQNGHGTHVAGAIAGNGRILGVGPDLKLAAYRVFGPTGGASTADIAAALQAAADDNVDVINMSLGGYSWKKDPSSTPQDVKADEKLFNRAIQYAIKKGVTVVGSAGNNNLDLSKQREMTRILFGEDAKGITRRSPSNQDMIRVASNGQELNRAYYSNYGKGWIDVTAPGGDYGTKWLENYDYSLRDGTKRCLSTVPGGYAWYQGTSMAAPKVSALAGLIIAQHGKDVLSPAQVKHIIQSTAIDINKPGYDEEAGHGLISAVNALQ
jgi:subtilisin family serine protease